MEGRAALLGLCGLWTLGLPTEALAQSYGRVVRAQPYVELSSSSPIFGPGDDDQEVTVDLPFPFVVYYDAPRTQLRVSPNGAVVFDYQGNISGSNPAPGNGGFDGGFIAPFWDDLAGLGACGVLRGPRRRPPSGAPGHRAGSSSTATATPARTSGCSSTSMRAAPGTALSYGGALPTSPSRFSATMAEGPLGASPQTIVAGCTDDCQLSDLLGLADTTLDLYPDRGVDSGRRRHPSSRVRRRRPERPGPGEPHQRPCRHRRRPALRGRGRAARGRAGAPVHLGPAEPPRLSDPERSGAEELTGGVPPRHPPAPLDRARLGRVPDRGR